MNLIDLKRDIRYSVGDVNEEKFDDQRVLLAIKKVINSLNYKFHLNLKNSFIQVLPYKEKYSLPSDFYFLLDIRLDDVSILKKNIGTYNVEILGGSFMFFKLSPAPESFSNEINLVNTSANSTFNAGLIQNVQYKDGKTYVMYDSDYTDFISNIVATITDANYGIINMKYIADYDISLTSENIDIPLHFYDSIHFKVSSDLLSDDTRSEVQQKSITLLQKYEQEIKRIMKDALTLYNVQELTVDYRSGV